MKCRYYMIVAVVLTLAGGCTKGILEIETSERANPWTNLDFNNEAENFQFVIMADRAGGIREGVFANAIYKINLLGPEFVMCVGDLIEGNTEDEAELEQQWTQFHTIVSKLEMPFFYVSGNHDIGNKVMLKTWKERFDRTYYHFVYHDVLFLCLESEDDATHYDHGGISDEQLLYFEDVLNKYKDARWTIVLLHKPLWEQENDSWLRFEQLLGDHDYTVFAGHKHQYARAVRNDKSYIRMATTGGVSTLDGPIVGTFDHIAWITMTDDGPRIANLMLDGIHDENVTPYAMAVAARMLKDKIDEGKVIELDPIVIEGNTFTGGETKMYLRNFSALPMKVRGTFLIKTSVDIQPKSIETIVKPMSTKTVDAELVAGEPVSLEKPHVIRFNGEIEYSFGQKPVRSKVPSRLIIRRKNK